MNKRGFAIIMAAVCVLFPLSACTRGALPQDSALPDPTLGAQEAEAPQATYQKITAEEALARIEGEEEVLVVDVRTRAEYDERHIEGAILVPNETIGDEMPALLPDLDAHILLYCRSGNRSAQAAKKLIALGYTQVYDFGGIIDWPYETVSG